MRSFFSALAVVIALSAVFYFTLETSIQQRADEAFSSRSGVRIPGHGQTHNLVGTDWSSSTRH
jgi:hypothetical protein